MKRRSGRVTVRDLDELPAFGAGGLASRIIADETVGVENVSVGVVEFETTLRKLWIFAPQGPERAIRARGADPETGPD